jgi:hypothetical protein
MDEANQTARWVEIVDDDAWGRPRGSNTDVRMVGMLGFRGIAKAEPCDCCDEEHRVRVALLVPGDKRIFRDWCIPPAALTRLPF